MVERQTRRPRTGEARFAAYLEEIVAELGDVSRAASARAYCTGLLLPGERKSVEPMAARIDAGPCAGQAPVDAPCGRQGGLGRCGAAGGGARRRCCRRSSGTGRCATGSWTTPACPKQGKHSVGVARQYCGQLGKQDNCQVAVSLSVANDQASLPIAYRLYLPEVWAADPARRARRGCRRRSASRPSRRSRSTRLRQALADRRAGRHRAGRRRLWRRHRLPGRRARRWACPTCSASAAARRSGPPGHGAAAARALVRPRPAADAAAAQPRSTSRSSAEELALSLPANAWRTRHLARGQPGRAASRFAALRVRPAHGDTLRSEPWPEEWLLIEWPEGARSRPSTGSPPCRRRTALKELVRTAKARWLIERDYEELKQEIGLGHYEGRGWRGFHHHASLCIAAYGFLVAERCLFPPQAPLHPRAAQGTCATPRFPAARCRRSGLSATCRTRSPPSDAASPSPSSASAHDAPAACKSSTHPQDSVTQ